jgi:hypothetical protein
VQRERCGRPGDAGSHDMDHPAIIVLIPAA